VRLYSDEKDSGLWLAAKYFLTKLDVHIARAPSFFHKDKYVRMFVFDNGLQLNVYASLEYNADPKQSENWEVSAVNIKDGKDD
jgi:hypothetical protein